MENRYVEEIEELILKINLLAYRIGAKTKHDVFARYYSLVNYLEIEIHLEGWRSGADPDYRKTIELNRVTVIEKLREVIKMLEELERGEKENV